MKTKLSLFILLSVIILTSCTEKNFTLERFNEISITTIDNKKQTLYKFLDSLNSNKPIILINYKVRHNSTKELLESMANDPDFASKFTIIGLNTDKTFKNGYDKVIDNEQKFQHFIKLNKKLVQKDLIKYHLIFNPSGNYHDIFFNGSEGEQQITVIKDHQVIYNNILYDNYPRSFEKRIISDLLKSEDKILQSEFTLENIKISYGFNNFKRTGDWKVEYLDPKKNHKIRSEGNYDNGTIKSYFLGKLEKQSSYKNGVLNGEYNEFDWSGGNLKETGNYLNGLKHGTWVLYDNKGNKKWEQSYVNGLKEGESKEYFTNGKTKWINNWKKDKREGLEKNYHDNDSISAIKFYKNGELNGAYKEFYKNRNVSATGNFKNGIQVGNWIYKYDNNVIKVNINYNKKGKQHGSDERYYSNKNISMKLNWIDGKLDGKQEMYWDNNQLKTLTKYKNGDLIEVLSLFDKKGNSLEKGNFSGGEGFYYNYNEEGKLLNKIKYTNGKVATEKSENEKKLEYYNKIKKTKIKLKKPEINNTRISMTRYSIKKYGIDLGNSYQIAVPIKIPEKGEVLFFYGATIEDRYKIISDNKNYPTQLYNEYNVSKRIDFYLSGKSYYAPKGKSFLTQTNNDILIDEFRGKTCYIVYEISKKNYEKYPKSSDLDLGYYVFKNKEKLNKFTKMLDDLRDK